MKPLTALSLFVLIAVGFSPALMPVETADAESGGLEASLAKAYLEKKAPGDTGSCLVENMKMNIIGISDVVPGHQAEVFYQFDYKLRCNRGSELKSGRGVLRAARLRDGNWIDRETLGVISK